MTSSHSKAARQDGGGRVPAYIAAAKQFRRIVSLLVTEGASTPPTAAATWAFKSYWTPDDAVSQCMCCKHTKFSLGTRRHHCRWCGDVVCSSCARKTKLPDSPVLKAELVCFTCFQKIIGGNDSDGGGGLRGGLRSVKPSMHARPATGYSENAAGQLPLAALAASADMC